MQLKSLTPTIYVAAQISVDDIPELAAQGIKSIICNRPDGEEYHQPEFELISTAAKDAGIECAFIPLAPGGLTSQIIADFGDALQTLPEPTVAYCRSGTRSTTLWALSQAGKRPAQEIISLAGNAGYDISGLAGSLGA